MNKVTKFTFNKSFAELETDELLELEFEDLPAFLEHNGIKQIYRAKNNAYQFDVLDDEWQLGIKDTLYLRWMWDGNFSVIAVLMLRLGLARQAESLTFSTIKTRNAAIKNIKFSLNNPRVFQESYYQLKPNFKVKTADFFHKMSKDDSPRCTFLQTFFTEVFAFLTETSSPKTSAMGQNILDPVKGMYSEAEGLEINNKLRIRIAKALDDCRDSFINEDLNKLGTVIAVLVMKSIFRRPGQLAQLKWIDVLPVGVSFNSHRSANQDQIPKEEHFFSDVEALHIRTFRGKSGEFRKQAEPRSHRIEAGFSNLILQYRVEYQRRLEACLSTQNINLSKAELTEIMFQLPIFTDRDLFSINFGSKEALLQSVDYSSEAFHKSSNALAVNISNLAKSLNLVTDRGSKNLTLSSCRFRHTVLTNGVWANMDALGLSKITGVTVRAVTPYIDLSTGSRFQINAAFAQKKVFKQFGMVSVAELSKSEQFKVTNEFGVEQGILHKASHCSTCESKLGRPIGCYGCDNFRPHIQGDHQAAFEKAQKKLAFNQEGGGSPITTRKLERSILFIQATILMCNEYQNMQKGIKDERN